MRRFGISVLAGAAFSFAAGAALAAPLHAPAYSWSGFYVGGNIGHGAATRTSDAIFTGVGAPSTFGPFSFAHAGPLKRQGINGGVQIGSNRQVFANWVFGLEADWQGSGEKGGLSTSDAYSGTRLGFTAAGTANTSYDAKILWFGTVRGRVGYAADRLLFFGTAGLAYGQVNLAGTMVDSGSTLVVVPPFIPDPYSGTASFSASRVKAGWTAGAGVEGALVDRWTWKAEYLFVDLGSLSLVAPGPFAATINAQARFTDNIVRGGVNYRFGN